MASSSRGVAPSSISSVRARTPSMRCWYSGTRSPRKLCEPIRAASAPGVIGFVLVVNEGRQRFAAVIFISGLGLAGLAQQYFHLLLRGAQRRLALARESDAAFESRQRLFERDVSLLEFLYQ